MKRQTERLIERIQQNARNHDGNQTTDALEARTSLHVYAGWVGAAQMRLRQSHNRRR
jgi:hypothetical protein